MTTKQKKKPWWKRNWKATHRAYPHLMEESLSSDHAGDVIEILKIHAPNMGDFRLTSRNGVHFQMAAAVRLL